MPWTAADAQKKYTRLTKKQSEVWAKVANTSLEAGDDEATAIKKANAAVSRMRKSEALTEGAMIVQEIGRSISSANASTIRACIKAMQDAMTKIAPLIADDADEEVKEVIRLDQEIEPVLQEQFQPIQKWEIVRLDEAAKILAQSDSYDSIRYAVQDALRKRAITERITAKLGDGSNVGYSDYYDYGCMPYIRDLYDGFVVYSLNGELYQCDYTIAEDVVTLGDATEVKISYVPVTNTESKQVKEVVLRGDLIQLSEKAVRDDGKARVCLITPGWGSSGYYSSEVLKRDGPKVFPKGTHMYMNHPTEEEDRVRPERDLRDLAGVIVSEVAWEDASATNVGAGLYADVDVFSTYRNFIDEAAPHIGTSIRAAGTAVEGAADGRHGLLVDELKEGYSVDFVTMAGRGGQILSLYESARKKIVDVTIDEKNSGKIVVETKETKEVITVPVDITEEELTALRESANKTSALEQRLNETTTALTESQTTIARMNEAMLLSEARTIVASTLAAIQLPDITRARLVESCSINPPITADKTLDKEKLIENIKASAAEELKYLESVTGSVTGGRVVGMSQPANTELKEEDVDKELNTAFATWGLSENASKVAANGRIN